MLTSEGLTHLFKFLTGHQYITSLELLNGDCYTTKLKIGAKGAESLERMLSHPDCLISNLEMTDACLTPNGHYSVARGVLQLKSLVSLNLQGNDFGSSSELLDLLAQLLTSTLLTYLNLAQNKINNKGAAKLASCLERNVSLSVLDISHNNFNLKGVLKLFKSLKDSHSDSKLHKLILDGTDLSKGKLGDGTFKQLNFQLQPFL